MDIDTNVQKFFKLRGRSYYHHHQAILYQEQMNTEGKYLQIKYSEKMYIFEKKKKFKIYLPSVNTTTSLSTPHFQAELALKVNERALNGEQKYSQSQLAGAG